MKKKSGAFSVQRSTKMSFTAETQRTLRRGKREGTADERRYMRMGTNPDEVR